MAEGASNKNKKTGESAVRLVEIMSRLRAPDGCPWDREQMHHTLTPYIIEEAYEVIDAIDDKDDAGLQEELGDLLLQVVFHAQIAAERGVFTFDDVVDGICEKLIRRHPHVFSNITVEDAREVIANWEQIKRKEKAAAASSDDMKPKGRFDGLPKNLPSLLKTYRVFEKMARMESLPTEEEALSEFKAAAGDLSPRTIGRLLFLLARYAQRVGVEPEEALRRENDAFIKDHNHA